VPGEVGVDELLRLGSHEDGIGFCSALQLSPERVRPVTGEKTTTPTMCPSCCEGAEPSERMLSARFPPADRR
jgi:hypothetical protein